MEEKTLVKMQVNDYSFIRKPKPQNWISRLKLPLILMALPTVVYIAIFCYIPIGGIIIAFKNYRAATGIFNSPWAGLGGFEHFYSFLIDPDFWGYLKNTLALSIWSIVVNTLLPIIYALFLNEVRHKLSKKVIQIMMYAPYFVSVVVVVGMLFSFFRSESGILTRLVMLFGLDGESLMQKPESFVAIYIISGVWQGLGWWSIIYMGSLANVDPNLHDAAKIDGAGRIRRIFSVNLPSILPMCIIVLIMNLGTVLSVGFEKVYLMQTVGNLTSSEIIATYVYRISFMSRPALYSKATAIGLFNTVINVLILSIANFVSKKVSSNSLW